MGSLIVAVPSLVLDGIKVTSAFTTSDTATQQTPEVLFGWKANWKRREKVFTANWAFEQDPATIRQPTTTRKERGEFDLVILVEGMGQDVLTASTRALVLGSAMETWVATHSNWNSAITGLNWIVVQGRGGLEVLYADKGVLVELTYHLAYNARLT